MLKLSIPDEKVKLIKGAQWDNAAEGKRSIITENDFLVGSVWLAVVLVQVSRHQRRDENTVNDLPGYFTHRYIHRSAEEMLYMMSSRQGY
ncbi:hypothetical protein RRG08_002932 [Elysia crispata]|uniref:Uncharacterized protein n=1 Tax=Elysia crispata TaxID=231223 RepID=A0AAE1ARU1_9GAST|nr:hypothetical protein RRG08_002932 [Elysia crispata]